MRNFTSGQVIEILGQGINPYLRKVYFRLITRIAESYDDKPSPSAFTIANTQSARGRLCVRVAHHLARFISRENRKFRKLWDEYLEFNKRYLKSATQEEREHNLLSFSKQLGFTPDALKKDVKAMKRWFGHDTVTDRYLKRQAMSERIIAFALERLGVMCAIALKEDGEKVGHQTLWRVLALEKATNPMFTFPGDTRVRIMAMKGLSTAIRALPESLQETVISADSIQFIYKSALDRRQETWIQVEALSLLLSLSKESFQGAIENRIGKPGAGDDMFIRRSAVKLMGERLADIPELRQLFKHIVHDPSPYVRQALAQILVYTEKPDCKALLEYVIEKDRSAQVRAAMILGVLKLLDRKELYDVTVGALLMAFEKEKDEFAIRVVLKTVVDCHQWFVENDDAQSAKTWRETFYPVIERLRQTTQSIRVRRWAARAREKIWVMGDDGGRELFERFTNGIKWKTNKTASHARIPSSILKKHSEQTIGRTLSVIAQQDAGYTARPGLLKTHIIRGDVFGFRLWRLLHEFFNPSTEKRQAFSHTVGRIFNGRLRAPSAIMSELSETKVPGEPLYMAQEDGWRNYLPLVDEVISALDNPPFTGPVQLYTSEGVTKLYPPGTPWRRAFAGIRLTRKFAHYARLRNWRDNGQSNPDEYIKSLKKLGFRITFEPHCNGAGESCFDDPSVRRFFPSLMAVSMSDQWRKITDYFFSIYENSLQELGVFILAITAVFAGRHIYISREIRKARKHIPLSIGGWGTRGKSGTERLKAAMFNAMGMSVLSKTTGCEAFFIHAHPYSKMREMFIFRPYDKATIWEQFNILKIGARLDVDVFLWECMGLTPEYVKILQYDWMRDDISTITNTYPDHEDLQGPAGVNIPEVMTNFIPPKATLISSEEHMTPILMDGARQADTKVIQTGWLEAGLLTPDIMDRFPYSEHPHNIALVLSLADQLGVERDFALKEIADRVIPDIGVLKEYPPAPIKTRTMVFVNGMSANERFATLENWKRMRFDKPETTEDPRIWITAVINNRADRVARSQVFAGIMAQDISVDRYVLIGTNLKGMIGYIDAEWSKFAGLQTLWPDSDQTANPSGRFNQMARRLRVPATEDAVIAMLKLALGKTGFNPDEAVLRSFIKNPDGLADGLESADAEEELAEDIAIFFNEQVTCLNEYLNFSEKLEQAGAPDNAIDREYRDLIETWFKRKILLIEDQHATGNRIIDFLIRQTPPGMTNRVMGMQNIKGTGLDFVYRWQAWETCHQALEKLKTDDADVAEEGLRELARFQDYGPICEETVKQTVETVKHSPIAQNEKFQAELEIIMSNLSQAIRKTDRDIKRPGAGGALGWMVDTLEAFLDAGDAVKRRKMADRIYTDLINEHISHATAAMSLQELNKRQKGGWLLAQLDTLRAYLER